MIYKTRNRTKVKDIEYALHLYFNGLSLRNTATALSRFVHRSHTAAIRVDWIQKYKPKRMFYRKTNVDEFIIDETQIKVGSEYIGFGLLSNQQKIKRFCQYLYQKKEICL